MASSAFVDRAAMSVASAPGTGIISLGQALATYQTFAGAGCINGGVYSYVLIDGLSWELGQGTYSSTGPTFTRSSIFKSSNSNTPIYASANAVVFITVLAEDLTYLAFSTLTVAQLASVTNLLTAFASNGLKIGETTGNGTGVPVYYSGGIWRVFSSDQPVQS